MKSEESTSKKKSVNFKKGTKIIVLIFAVVLLVAMIPQIVSEYLKSDEEMEGFTLYNASRFFFRFYYPDDWTIEKEASGFLMDDETGLVVVATPDSNLVSVSFYYKNGGSTMTETMVEFENQFSYMTFGKIDELNVDNQKTKLVAKPISYIDEVTGKTIKGTIYYSTRSIAHYAIVVSYEDESEYEKYKGQVDSVVKSYFHSVNVLDSESETN